MNIDFFFFKQKTAYEMRISDWSSDVCSSDLLLLGLRPEHITETHRNVEPNQQEFQATPEVTEPLGMETMVYVQVDGADVCGRVKPTAGAEAGPPMQLRADLNTMHLIDVKERQGDVTGESVSGREEIGGG